MPGSSATLTPEGRAGLAALGSHREGSAGWEALSIPVPAAQGATPQAPAGGCLEDPSPWPRTTDLSGQGPSVRRRQHL